MAVDFLLERFAEASERHALVWRGRPFTYRDLLDRIEDCRGRLERRSVRQSVVLLVGDYSPNGIASWLALVQQGCIVVPCTGEREHHPRISQAEWSVVVSESDELELRPLGGEASHPLYEELRARGNPGLVLFSSGSTGRVKAAVHDVTRLLRKYEKRRRDLRTLAFLLFDHIAGVDTLLYTLGNASCLVTIPDRAPETVCRAVEEHAVEVLAVSPSFLNLLLLGRAYEHFDLASLKVITYGAEVMPEATLRRCHEVFPGVELLQKFGTTEVGTLRSKSRTPDSTWVKIGGEGYQVRVVDGMLQIKADSAILGYLNAPHPFTEDGWFITGDLVEVDGDYLRILGRENDVVNVGGEKVHPAEVESVIQEIPEVQDVAVYGEPNAILGHVVGARVVLSPELRDAGGRETVRKIKAHCRRRLPSHQVPLKIVLVEGKLHTERFKKRRTEAEIPPRKGGTRRPREP